MKKLILHAHGHAKSHYEKHYKTPYKERSRLVFLLDAVLVTTALGLLALGSYFNWFYHPLRDDFRLNVSNVGEIVGGQEGEIGVEVENVGKETLKDARLTVYLPDAFLAADGMVGTREIEIGLLPAGTSARYGFRGMPLGAPRAAKVVAHFEAHGMDGRYDERLVAGDLKWERSLIETRFEAPTSIIPGQTVRFRLQVKNGSALKIENTSVKLTWPEGFRLINASPPVYRGAVALGRLEAGEEAYVDFTARLMGAADLQRLKAELTGVITGRAFSLYISETEISLADAGLEISAVFAHDAPAYVRPGEDVSVVVRYRNQGAQPIKDLTLGVNEDPRVISSVRWETSASVGDLAPGASGERTAFIHVLDPISQYVVNPMLRVTPTARFSIENPNVEGAEIAGAGAERKVTGAVYWRVAARYFTSEGDQIGRGPLPPKVGVTTRYWILANIETGAAETSGVRAVFDLPPEVVWTGRGSVSNGSALEVFEHDHIPWATRLVSQIEGRLPAHTGVLTPPIVISFEVALTPLADQLGMQPPLLLQSSLTGYQAWPDRLNGSLSLSAHQGAIDTSMPGDAFVNGRAVVRP